MATGWTSGCRMHRSFSYGFKRKNCREEKGNNLEDIYIVPAAGDSGICLGNAYYGYYKILNKQGVV